MHWFQSLDTALFRFVNSSLQNGFFDSIMPLVSDTPFFNLGVTAISIIIFLRGTARARLCVALLLLAVLLGDGLVCGTIKQAVQRVRPFNQLPEVHLLVGKSASYGMPSSHSANWFAATMVAFMFYRRSIFIFLPLACAVAFSRVYNGVHYPADVVAGAVLGAGYGGGFVWLCNQLWQAVGPRWAPSIYTTYPDLLRERESATVRVDQVAWLRWGELIIGLSLAARLIYLYSGKIELSEDEAYQWLWSKHLALSYYSKPPLIALVQFIGTHLWGDTQFGVRFFSPVIAAGLSWLVLRFLSWELSPKAGFAAIVILSTMPMTGAGAILMTVDPLSVLFWTLSLIAAWRAMQTGSTSDWLWLGCWAGLGSLSKYTNLLQWFCLLLFFLLQPSGRSHLRRPGFYLAIGLNLLFLLPVLLWNQQHGWVTVEHVASDGRLGEPLHLTLRFVGDFVGSEIGLLNPIFLLGMIWAAFRIRRYRTPLLLYFFSMSAPVVLPYFLLSFHSRVLPNWIAPAIIPLVCLLVGMALQQDPPPESVRRWFKYGASFGLILVVLMHDTNLLQKFIRRTLPMKIDPHHRVHGWKETALAVEAARQNLAHGAELPFVIGDHYGMVSQISFHSPGARQAVLSVNPYVYFRESKWPENQFFFWPGYRHRTGQNAIFVMEEALPDLRSDWLWAWLRGETELDSNEPTEKKPVPSSILEQFEQVNDRGVQDIVFRNKLIRRLHLFDCQHLKQP